MKETKFKQTEVGLIPSDWEVKKIKDFAKVYDGTHQTPHYVNFGVQFYSVENVTANDFVHTKFISEQEHTQLSARVKIEKGDILMTRIGSIGDCKYVNWSPKASFYVSLALIKCNKSVCPQFISYYSNSAQFKKELELRSLLTAIPQKINLGPISEIILCLPPFEEQKRIAQALSDVDAIITTTEKLIAKKKALKQGTMQTLLSGKMRIQNGKWTKTTDFKQTELGPIPQEWEIRSIGETAKIIGGGTPSTFNPDFWNGEIAWFTPAELSKAGKYVSNSERTISSLGLNNSSAKMLPKGTILLTTRASIGVSAILEKPACTNQGFQSLVANKDYSNEFLYYLLKTKVNEMVGLASGSTFLEISPKKLGGILLSLPPTKEEQISIATVLSDMDSEIAALETKLAKYRQLKTGMMQQLLTGKIRLI